MGGGESHQTIPFNITLSCVVQGDVIIQSTCLHWNPTLHPFLLTDFTSECKYTLSLVGELGNTEPAYCGPARLCNQPSFKSSKRLLETSNGMTGDLLIVMSGQVLVRALKGWIFPLLGADCFLTSSWKPSLKLTCLFTKVLDFKNWVFSSPITI